MTQKQNEISRALALVQEGKSAEAMQAARQAAAFARAEGDKDKLAGALAILCRSLMSTREFIEAELRLLELISLKHRLQASDSELADCFDMLSRCYKKLGKRQLALTAAAQSIGYKRSAFGQISRQVADSNALIGCIHLEAGDALQAESYLKSALDIYVSALGEERSESIVTASRLGLAEGILGKDTEARKHFALALAGLNSSLGASTKARLEYLNRYASFLRLSGQHKQAISVESEFFQLAAERYGFSLE